MIYTLTALVLVVMMLDYHLQIKQEKEKHHDNDRPTKPS